MKTHPLLGVFGRAVFAALILVVLSLLSLAVGPAGLRNPLSLASDTISLLRLYRTLAALGVGLLLGVAGAVIQYSTGNPLASPSILGLPQGALAAVAAATLLSRGSLAWGLGLLVGALGALAAYWASLLIAVRAGGSSASLVLAGVAVASASTGLAGLLVYLVQTRYGVLATDMLLGSFAYATRWRGLVAFTGGVAAAAVATMLSRVLDALSYGDEIAAGMGFQPRAWRAAATGVAAFSVALSIYAAGVVGFIGLIAPNTARQLFGPRPSLGVPGSAIIGASLALAADTGARLVAPLLGLGELPAGTATSIAGGFFLAYLVSRRRGVAGL